MAAHHSSQNFSQLRIKRLLLSQALTTYLACQADAMYLDMPCGAAILEGRDGACLSGLPTGHGG